MRLAIFDLDNTLITGDSDHLWGEYLAERGVVDGDRYRRENDRFLAQYQAGTLDIHEFLRFSLRVLCEHDDAELQRLRAGFIDAKIAPIVAPGTPSLLARHREAGDHLMIITATNSFVTAPIARMLGVDTLIATDPEWRDGGFTGSVAGIPCFREGKVQRLEQWRREQGAAIERSAFYTDSHNDLPLLERVERPCAVDPDRALDATARARNWPLISLRDG